MPIDLKTEGNQINDFKLLNLIEKNPSDNIISIDDLRFQFCWAYEKKYYLIIVLKWRYIGHLIAVNYETLAQLFPHELNCLHGIAVVQTNQNQKNAQCSVMEITRKHWQIPKKEVIKSHRNEVNFINICIEWFDRIKCDYVINALHIHSVALLSHFDAVFRPKYSLFPLNWILNSI